MNISHSSATDLGSRAALGVPAHASLVTVDGIPLAVARDGAGPPLVCLHATGHGGGDFAWLARTLAGEYEVIRVDWPGHGRSPRSISPSPARYGKLLIALLDQLGISNPTLIGNSIGGAAAIHYALARPVRALVLCNPGGLIPIDPAVRAACAVLTRFFDAGARGARWFMPLFTQYYRRLVLPRAAAREQRERIIASGYEQAALIRDAWHSFSQPEADLCPYLPSLKAPVWVAWARNDRLIPLALCKPAIDSIPDATLSLFDAGHAPFLEQPAAFLAGFRRFMSTLPPVAVQSVATSSASRPS